MYSKKIIYLCIVISLVMLVFTGCTKKAKPTSTIPGGEQVASEQSVTQPEASSQEEQKPQTICPLTGLPEDEKYQNIRPIAVMIDNEYNARPQSGLINADIVYEFPVEGNITRYMAIFHHTESEKIGPVRSARPYFIDTALEYNAVYVHCGGSPQALKDIETLKVDALNDLKGSPCFWRARDRKMPHNLYTSTKLMREVMNSKKMENKSAPEYFKFSEDFLNLDGKNTNTIIINYDKNYRVGYQYDAVSKLFYRTINGARLKDKETETEISTTNIIIQKVKTKVLDSAGRLELSNIGTDRGYLLTGGKLIEITWEKTGRSTKTTYNVKIDVKE